jgi:hypothetical protein
MKNTIVLAIGFLLCCPLTTIDRPLCDASSAHHSFGNVVLHECPYVSRPVETPAIHDAKVVKRVVRPAPPSCKNGRHPSGEPMKLRSGFMLL